MHSGFSRTRVFSYALAKPEGSDGKYKKDLGVPKHALTERDYCTQMERLTIIPASGNTKLCRLRTWGANPVSNITFSNGSSVIYPYVREQVIDNAGVEENRTDYFLVLHIGNLLAEFLMILLIPVLKFVRISLSLLIRMTA